MSLKRFILATSTIVLCAVFAAVLPARQVGRGGATPDVIYYNAKVVTVDAQFSYAQAVAITGDKFTAVGTNDSVRALAGPNTQLVNLRGLTVIPGLTDNHLHNAGGGPGVDFSRTRTIDEVLKAVGDRVKRAEPGEVVISNSDWHEAQLKEQRLPLRRDLDKVAPMTPVVLVRGGHEYVLNSAARQSGTSRRRRRNRKAAGSRGMQTASSMVNSSTPPSRSSRCLPKSRGRSSSGFRIRSPNTTSCTRSV